MPMNSFTGDGHFHFALLWSHHPNWCNTSLEPGACGGSSRISQASALSHVSPQDRWMEAGTLDPFRMLGFDPGSNSSLQLPSGANGRHQW